MDDSTRVGFDFWSRIISRLWPVFIVAAAMVWSLAGSYVREDLDDKFATDQDVSQLRSEIADTRHQLLRAVDENGDAIESLRMRIDALLLTEMAKK